MLSRVSSILGSPCRCNQERFQVSILLHSCLKWFPIVMSYFRDFPENKEMSGVHHGTTGPWLCIRSFVSYQEFGSMGEVTMPDTERTFTKTKESNIYHG